MEDRRARFTEAEDIYARLGHTDSQAWMRVERGAVLQTVGKYDEAVTLLEESLRLYRPDNQGMNPAMTHLNLWESYFGLGRLEEAGVEYRGCLEMLQGQSSPESPIVVAWTLTALAHLAASRGRFEHAAHLLGAGKAIPRSMLMFPAERAELEDATRLTRAALGEDAFAAALSVMENITVEEAIAFGLDTGTSR